MIDFGGRKEKSQHWREIGLVGPMSNYASPPQLVQDVPYRDLDEMKVLRNGGETSIVGSGLPCPSSRDFVCL